MKILKIESKGNKGYDLESKDSLGRDLTLEVLADSRSQARKKAEKLGYEIMSVNFTG